MERLRGLGVEVRAVAWPLLLPFTVAVEGGTVGGAVQRLLDVLRGLLGGLSSEMDNLPPGSPPLVMIFGGLFVVAMALLLSMVASLTGVHPAPAATPAPSGRTWHAPLPAPPAARYPGLPLVLPPATASAPPLVAATSARPAAASVVVVPRGTGARTHQEGLVVGRALGLGDIDGVLDAAAHLGLGEPHLEAVQPHHLVVWLTGCQTCRLRPATGPGQAGCEFERGFLEGAAAGLARRPVVTEALCARAAGGACKFDVYLGG